MRKIGRDAIQRAVCGAGLPWRRGMAGAVPRRRRNYFSTVGGTAYDPYFVVLYAIIPCTVFSFPFFHTEL